MKKIKLFSTFILFLLLFTGCKVVSNKNVNLQNNSDPESGNDNYSSDINSPAEKLEVYYFHRTQRCVSCKAIGELVDKTMYENFLKQIDADIIEYRVINIDLPENKELARKFQATGSSLFINSIRNEQDDIENIMDVWTLKNDDLKFKSFLNNKINKLLQL